MSRVIKRRASAMKSTIERYQTLYKFEDTSFYIDD